ncbi:peptidoglycan amidohydrolase family protein [Enterococcus thailandicus]|uniref:C40 family peptidase n=1 Tax=Enterococcus thailandicus TaxID=417368 RepID=UPI0032DAC16A
MMSKESMIQWMQNRLGKVTYSMTHRLGPNSYDCSSAVFLAMIAGGFLSSGSMGNTETLFGMVGTKLKKISRSEVQRGDIFVSGTPGGSSGSAGHTGIFLSNGSFIHCSYTHNGIAIDTNDAYMGTRLQHNFYRIIEGGSANNTDDKPQMIQLEVDGLLGSLCARRVQEYLDTIGKDGIISHQYKQTCNQYVYAAQFDSTLIGSNVIVALQKFLRDKGTYKGKIDGLLGEETIRALQMYLGTTQDGIISAPSDVVKELQRRLNANKL